VVLLLPLFAFLCGLGLATTAYASALKTMLATLLARVFIPAVIIYNMVFYQAGSLSLMIFSFIVAVILFYFFWLISQDKLQSLCFSYVNMAWLGFPFAIALFGPEISAPMVALYIGGSIFGNIWAVTAVSSEQQSWKSILQKVLQSPPVIALTIAVLCRLFGFQYMPEHKWIDILYGLAKIGMSFAGMCVLGMWLRRTKVQLNDITYSVKLAVLKLCCGLVLCSLTYFFISIPHIGQYIGVMYLLFCLPPAANIVALETHYQGTGISAKYIASGTMVSCAIILIYGLLLHIV